MVSRYASQRVRWAGQPPPNCEMLAAVAIPETTLAKLADGGPPAYAKSCFALRHCRADILPRVADFHRPVDDPETIAHIVAHCYLKRESNVSNACCAGSPYPGTGGGSGESLRRPPPPPNPSPPKPPPPNPTLTLPDAVNAKSRVHRKFSPY